jgi:hypothetical protein
MSDEPIFMGIIGRGSGPNERADCAKLEAENEGLRERLTNAEIALAALAEFGDGTDRSPVAARMRERAREALAALRGQ